MTRVLKILYSSFFIIPLSMPLIIICGYPCSGKTRLASKLQAFLHDHPLPTTRTIHLVNEESLTSNDDAFPSNAAEEKKLRAALLAASERHLAKDSTVILDSLNYIKGFRYQLYCQARAAATPHLVIHCQAREDTCRRWNDGRTHRIYHPDLLDDLILRFEPPNNQNKWDSPLFGIVTEDASEADFITLFQSLLPILNSTPNRPPSTATLTNKPSNSSSSFSSSPSNSIQILDHETQAILDIILKAQLDNLPSASFPNSSKTLSITRPVSLATLSRIRRQFLHMNRLHPVLEPEKIRSLFIDFLAANMYL